MKAANCPAHPLFSGWLCHCPESKWMWIPVCPFWTVTCGLPSASGDISAGALAKRQPPAVVRPLFTDSFVRAFEKGNPFLPPNLFIIIGLVFFAVDVDDIVMKLKVFLGRLLQFHHVPFPAPQEIVADIVLIKRLFCVVLSGSKPSWRRLQIHSIFDRRGFPRRRHKAP